MAGRRIHSHVMSSHSRVIDKRIRERPSATVCQRAANQVGSNSFPILS